jgi:hypothetical protein
VSTVAASGTAGSSPIDRGDRPILCVSGRWRLRLYLVDLPDGMSVETLAISVVAPGDRFDAVIAETAPIIESIEFHPG